MIIINKIYHTINLYMNKIILIKVKVWILKAISLKIKQKKHKIIFLLEIKKWVNILKALAKLLMTIH